MIDSYLANLKQEDRVDIVYYTDPLCCWSWALQPHWYKLLVEHEGQINFKYVMGGLFKDWNSFHDPMNSVTKPSQMGPVWMEAKHISGMPIQENIWIHDAPSSSYPACLAVKTAGLQSKMVGDVFLDYLREAIMEEGKNIAKVSVIMEVAEKLAVEQPIVFSLEKFKQDFNSEASREAFRADLELTQKHKISRFPTLTIKRPNGRGVIITGYRPYSVLESALHAVYAFPEMK